MLRSLVSGFSLALLVVGLSAEASAQKGMVQSGNRSFCRYLEFLQTDSDFSIPVQFTFEYSPVAWKDEFGAAMKSAKKGERLRLGKDTWTAFDTNAALTIGGQAVPAGHYYLAAEKGEGDALSLVFLESAAVRAKKFDAFQSEKATGGIVVPLKGAVEADKKSELNFTITSPDANTEIAIAFGPNRYTAPITQAKAKAK